MKKKVAIPGRRVRCEGAHTAFIPAPLPPKLEWTSSLVSALSEADRLIGRLAGEGYGLPQPLLYLSAFFEATRADYYDLLRGVTDRGEWESWLEYFLNGVARQAEDALSRTHRLNERLAQWRLAAAGMPSRTPVLLLDMLADNPFITVTRAVDKLGVAFTTVQRAIDRLESLSILTRVGQAKRDRVYCAKELLAILDEPARLASAQTLRNNP